MSLFPKRIQSLPTERLVSVAQSFFDMLKLKTRLDLGITEKKINGDPVSPQLWQ